MSMPSDEPLVSVVIPTYNSSRFLSSAIESVLQQDYSHVEVVVVDDGSTDTTRAVVEPFADAGVQYLFQRNLGPGPARDAGVRASTGALVAFLDSDDTWLPGKLTRQVAHLQRFPGLGLVGGAYIQCDERNVAIALSPALDVDCGDLFEKLLVQNVIHTSTVVVRRECLESVGGFASFPIGEDWDTWLRIAQRYPIGFVREATALRRAHPASVSHTHTARRPAADAHISGAYLHHVAPAWKRHVVRARTYAASYYFCAAASHADGDDAKARALLVRSLALDPVTGFEQKAALLLKTTLPPRAFDELRRARRLAMPGTLPRRAQ